MNLLDLISLHQLGSEFYGSITAAFEEIERRIKNTPTTNVFSIRSGLWGGVITKHILTPEQPPKQLTVKPLNWGVRS